MKLKLLSLGAILFLGSCTKSNKTEIWIYTSVYKEVISVYDKAIEKDLPDIKVKWFQQGSENVAAKVLAEESAGGTKADMLMTSDLFFYQDMKKAGKFLTLPEEVTKGTPPEAIDPDRAFFVNRYPVMVIAYNKEALKEADRPKSFKDLVDPKYKGKITMPSPLESGTAMTSILFLHKLYGSEYFKGLRQNEILASGGNGSTFSRIQSGEKLLGLVLMENVLQAKEKGNQFVEFLIPEEGGLPMPSPVAILKNSKQSAAALKLLTWFSTPAAQDLLIKGWYYSSHPDVKAPNGAPEWASLKLQAWSFKTFEEWGSQKQAIKDEFQNTILK